MDRESGTRTLDEGERYLSVRDPRMARLIERVRGADGLTPQALWAEARPALEALLRAIVGQQLSGAAARTIFARFKRLLDADVVTPQTVLALPESTLRSVGMSSQKARFLHSVCRAVATSQLDLSHMAELSDEQVMEALIAIDGIGRWTAEMFLIFHLQRPDILSCHDVGIRRGLQIAYGLPSKPAPQAVADIGMKWSPHRTLASRYLWAAVNLKLVPEVLLVTLPRR